MIPHHLPPPGEQPLNSGIGCLLVIAAGLLLCVLGTLGWLQLVSEIVARLG